MGFGVLKHHLSIAIIRIRQSKGSLIQAIEEALLSLEILLHRAMVVEMVASEVRKDPAVKL